MKKRFLSIILLLCMLLALLPVSALAEDDAVAGGHCGSFLTWSLDSNGTLTISGSGSMNNYATSLDVPWYSNRTSIRTVVIDADVRSIGNFAFYDCDNLMSIATCGEIDSIGNYAFCDCGKLDTASFIGQTSIGKCAFESCSSLKTVAFNPKSIGDHAFDNCESLESIYLSYYNFTGVTISASAFNGVNAKVYYPEYSTIYSSYKKIFGNNMIFEEADHGYFGSVCWKYDNANKKLTISGIGSVGKVSSGTKTPWYVYSEYSNLAPEDKQVKIIEVLPGITDIPSYCFEYMTSVEEIILPEGIKTFAPNSCNDCSSLNNLVIPSTVESFGLNGYFNRCNSLTDIFYVGTEEEWNKIPNAAQDMAYYPNQRVNFLKYNEPTATCTESGLEGYYAFDSSVVTGKYDANKNLITELKTVAPLGHDVVQHEAVAATCTEPGCEAYDTCNNCDYTTYKEIPALGHNYVDSICTRCGKQLEFVIIDQPVNYAGNEGDKARFEVVAEGDGLTYQWYYSNDGGNKWSRTSATGAKTSVVEPDLKVTTTGRMFKCEITDSNGKKLTTDAVKMYLAYSDIVITKQPEDYLRGKVNDLADFTVEAEGVNLKYQWQYSADGGETWQKSGNDGYNAATVHVRLYEYRDGYQYRCMIMSGRGDDSVVAYSEPAALNKIPATVQITAHPKDAYCVSGETAVFTVEATGDGLEYQWQYSTNGGETWGNSGMTGAKTDTLNVKAIASRNGQIYRCKVTDESGTSKYTKSVTLNIGEKAVISSQPESYTGPVNSNAVFSVTATGDDLTYQWYYRQSESGNWVKSGQADAQTDTLTVAVKNSRNGYQYRCEVTNAAGMITTSDIATLTVA